MNKNLIEVLFEFKDIGADVINQNREKLIAMAKVMEDASKQATALAKTHSEINNVLNDSSKVYEKKTKAQREAERQEKDMAKNKAKLDNEELLRQKQIADEEKKLAKEKLNNDRAAAAQAKQIADEAKKQAKEKQDIEKAALLEEKKSAKEKLALEKQINDAEKKRVADKKAADKERIANEKAVAAASKQRLAEEKAALKAQTDLEKQNAKQRIANAQEEERKQKELLKQKSLQQKQVSKEEQLLIDQEKKARDLAFLNERLQIVEMIKKRREKEQAEKEAMLTANRAARSAEKAAAQEIKAKEKVIAATKKATAINEKAAAQAAKKSGSAGNGGGPLNNQLNTANNEMEDSIKNLRLMKLGLAGVAAAAITAIVAFSRQSADEFYKMKLAAEANGFDVSVLQEYKSTLDAVGISTDQFAQKLRQLNEKFVEGFTENSGDGMEVIKTLNLEMEKFAKASPEKKFEMIVDATKDLSKVQRLQIFDKLSLDELNLVANRMDKVKERKEELANSGLIVTDEEAGRVKDIEQAFGRWKDELSAFSTIVYSALVPAFTDAFGGIFEGWDLSRNGANGFAIALIDVIKFLAKMTAIGKFAFDLIVNKFKVMGSYINAAADAIVYLFNSLTTSISGVVNIIKKIDLGTAIADLAKGTFSSIIDLVFDSIDLIVSGIEKVASSISGVIPDAVLNQIKETRSAISSLRGGLFKFEGSDPANNAIIQQEKENIEAELKLEEDKWKKKKEINKAGLLEIEKEGVADATRFAKKMNDINSKDSTDYLTTDAQLEQMLKKNKKDEPALKSMETDAERRLKIIERYMKLADTIKNQIELGIVDKNTGLLPKISDAFYFYDAAIFEASGNAELLAKQYELRLQRRDDEIAFNDKQFTRSTETVKKSLDNLKLLDSMVGDNVFENQTDVVAKYNQIIALARTYKKDELDINTIIKERDDYIKAAAESQKAYARTISDIETQLLEEQDKNQEVRERQRKKALEDIEEQFKNANPETRKKALDLTDSLFNIKNAKARISELDAEIDKLIEKRDTKTDVFDRTRILELETQINAKIAERGGLEESIGKKREESNDDFKLTMEDINGILENTLTNLSTLVASTISGVDNLKDATKKFFNSTLEYLAQLLQRLLLMKAVKVIGNYFGFSDFGAAAGSAGAESVSGLRMANDAPEYHIGGTVTGDQGNGYFSSMGNASAKEVNAVLNKKEAVLTETQQENLGNNIAGSSSETSGNITAVIHNNIDAKSLTKSISSTKEWKDAIRNEITRDRSTYRQILN